MIDEIKSLDINEPSGLDELQLALRKYVVALRNKSTEGLDPSAEEFFDMGLAFLSQSVAAFGLASLNQARGLAGKQ